MSTADPAAGASMSTADPATDRSTDSATPPAQGRPKRKRGCLATGCLSFLGLLGIMIVVVGALLLRVPQQLGLWSSGDQLMSGTPDRASAAAIVTELDQAGVDTTGLTLYVEPVEGQDGTLAYAVLDASKGFEFPTGASASPLLDLFGELASGPTVEAASIEQVAIEYRDPSGRRLGVLTASTDVIRRFVDGQIDEEAFSAQLHGNIDVAAALDALNQP